MTTNTAGLGPLTKLLPVTGTFSAPLITLASLLSFNVVKTRIDVNTWEGDSVIGAGASSKKVKQPDGNEYDPLLIATRIHGNAVENIPITLLLAALAEVNGADRRKLTMVLGLFSVLRVAHVIGLAKATQVARAAGKSFVLFFSLRNVMGADNSLQATSAAWARSWVWRDGLLSLRRTTGACRFGRMSILDKRNLKRWEDIVCEGRGTEWPELRMVNSTIRVYG